MKDVSISRLLKLLLFIGGAILLPLSVAHAEPSLNDVEQAIRNGQVFQADAMMQEVLKAHPNSAKAHFVAAEILVKEGRHEEARAHFNDAERLHPGLDFAKPAAVAELSHKLGLGDRQTVNPTTAKPAGGPNWLLWAGVIAAVFFIVMIIRSLTRPTPVATGYGPQSYAPQNQPPQGPYPYPPAAPQGGGLGSNIVGGLATGAAVGAGIVAGEMLMNKVLDGNHAEQNPQSGQHYGPVVDNNYDVGGDNLGLNDSSSWDDSAESDNSSDWT